MKAMKIVAVLIIVYVGIVVVFESLLGYFQPATQTTLVIATIDEDGVKNDRVLARLESDNKLYVSANHWPRAWYRQALENPNVEVILEKERMPYIAIPVANTEEHNRVESDNPHGIGFRILTGFAPRYFVRLEPL